MNFLSLVMPVGPKIKVLDNVIINEYQGKMLSLIGKEFFPDEKDRIFKMELFRQTSDHSAVFQVNLLMKIRNEKKEQVLVPQNSKFFILNFSPEDHKFQIILFHEIKGLSLNEMTEISKEDEKGSFEDSFENSNEFDDLPRLVNYFIFYNLFVYRDNEEAVVTFGQKICFEDDDQDINFPTGCCLLQFNSEGYIWYFPTTEMIEIKK